MTVPTPHARAALQAWHEIQSNVDELFAWMDARNLFEDSHGWPRADRVAFFREAPERFAMQFYQMQIEGSATAQQETPAS